MHVQPISTFRLFQEGHLLRNSIAIFVLTTLFYFIGAELRLVHELSLFWPLNGVMAGVFARYVWLNRLHYYAISYVAMLVYDAITTEWGLVSLAINFSNMMFIVTVALLVARDKRLGKNKYEPVSALRLFNYCLLAALLCAIVGAIGSVSIDSLDFWPLLADWFSEQFSTGVLIVPCMLTLAIPGVLPRFKAEQMMPAIALIVSVIASVVIGGAGSLAFPLPALIWCAVRYTPQVTCLLTFVTGAVEVVLVANSVIDISVGSPFSIPQMFSARLGIATMAICPIMVSFSVAAINSLMKQVALRADFDFLTQVYSRSGLYEALKSPSLKQTQHLTVMLLDIDYFKSINDNYGHECGDKVLSVFAQHIQKIVGDKGLVARMGGEEFAVAVPSVNPVDGLLFLFSIAVIFMLPWYTHLGIKFTLAPFSILGVAIAIFLGFRNNAGYARYVEARKLWGQLMIASRSLLREVKTTLPDSASVREFARLQIAFAHCLRMTLRKQPQAEVLAQYLKTEDLQRVLASNSPANRILLIMGEWLAVQRRNGQLSDILFISLNDRLNDISAVLAGCERIAYTPIPFAYTLILHRTVYLFCIMLPFALVVDLHYMTPFISVLISYTFISLDCLAEELEDPFGTENNDLPLDAICNAIEIDLLQMNDEAEIPAKILPDRHYQLT